MISLEELKEKARIKGLGLGNAEKDYLLDIILLSVSKRTKDELVFKGGTCLHKFHKLDRFSEDADFTAVKPVNIEKLIEGIISDMKSFGIVCSLHQKKEPFNSVLMALRCEGPLYKGAPQTYARVKIDINIKSSIDTEPLTRGYSSLYSEIPNFSMLIMQEKEILAEKIRAILSRNKARDVYDLWFLLSRGVAADENIIEKKLDYYNQKWDKKEFEKSLETKRSVWENELKPFLRKLPEFEKVKTQILSEAKKWSFQKRRQ